MPTTSFTKVSNRPNKIPAIGKPRLKQAIERLVQLYELTGAADQAAAWKQKVTDTTSTMRMPE